MRTLFSILTLYAYAAALQLAPSIPFQKLIASEQALHNVLCRDCAADSQEVTK